MAIASSYISREARQEAIVRAWATAQFDPSLRGGQIAGIERSIAHRLWLVGVVYPNGTSEVFRFTYEAVEDALDQRLGWSSVRSSDPVMQERLDMAALEKSITVVVNVRHMGRMIDLG
jgi:hypothetical protein